MKELYELDILMKLPYETITSFDGKNIKQTTVVSYSEIIKEINKSRKELNNKGLYYFNGKLKPI